MVLVRVAIAAEVSAFERAVQIVAAAATTVAGRIRVVAAMGVVAIFLAAGEDPQLVAEKKAGAEKAS